MKNVEQVCSFIGRQRLAAALGVKSQAISNATAAGTFPASWYFVIDTELKAKGRDVALSAFNFKPHLDFPKSSRPADLICGGGNDQA